MVKGQGLIHERKRLVCILLFESVLNSALQYERGYNQSKGNLGRGWEWKLPEEGPVLEEFLAVCHPEQSVSFHTLTSPACTLKPFRYRGPQLDIEADGSYISRLEFVTNFSQLFSSADCLSSRSDMVRCQAGLGLGTDEEDHAMHLAGGMARELLRDIA